MQEHFFARRLVTADRISATNRQRRRLPSSMALAVALASILGVGPALAATANRALHM